MYGPGQVDETAASLTPVGLGPSQHTKPPFPGVLELTELDVQGE